MTTKTELADIRRELRVKDVKQLIDRRCYSIFKHNHDKAVELHRESEIDFDLVRLRAQAHAVVGKPCHWCAKTLTAKSFSFDHKDAVNRGGLFAWANMMIICMSCNKKKGQLSFDEFSKLILFLHTLLAEARGDILRRLGLGAQWNG